MPVGGYSSPGSGTMARCMAFPSSRFRLTTRRKIAEACGFRVKKTLSMRTHICPECGLVLDRDWNAALNMLLAGLAWVVAHRTAGQAETGRSSERRNASGQKTTSLRGKPRLVKSAG